MDYSQDLKRKNVQDHTDMVSSNCSVNASCRLCVVPCAHNQLSKTFLIGQNTAKRPANAQAPSPFDAPMPHNNPYSMSAPPSTCDFQPSLSHPSNDANIPRCKSPPLGMTLAHFDPASGGYATSVLKSEENVSAPICSGMTPAYRPPIERWGSCML